MHSKMCNCVCDFSRSVKPHAVKNITFYLHAFSSEHATTPCMQRAAPAKWDGHGPTLNPAYNVRYTTRARPHCVHLPLCAQQGKRGVLHINTVYCVFRGGIMQKTAICAFCFKGSLERADDQILKKWAPYVHRL